MSAGYLDAEKKREFVIVNPTMQLFCDDCGETTAAPSAMAGRPIQCLNCKEYMIVPKTRFAPGVVVGDFILRQILGRGGMGMVFKAYQKSLDRTCALKILYEHSNPDESDGIDELLKEARLAAKLNHPNIVQCYAVGEEEGVYYYAMEYVEGKTLRTLLNERWKLPPGAAIGIIQQIAEALEHAWKKARLVHRDVKPENIMLMDDGSAKLADLGLARHAHDTDERGKDVMVGSPHFMCPEQVLGAPMDYRGDMYSLGAVLYMCVTGKCPFVGSSLEDTAAKHLEERPIPANIHTPDLPHKLCQVIDTMLARRPEDRYADFEALHANLAKAIEQCSDTSVGGSASINLYRHRAEGRPQLRVLRKVEAKQDKDSEAAEADHFEEIAVPDRLSTDDLMARPHPMDSIPGSGEPVTDGSAAEGETTPPHRQSRLVPLALIASLTVLAGTLAVGWIYQDRLMGMIRQTPKTTRRTPAPPVAAPQSPPAWPTRPPALRTTLPEYWPPAKTINGSLRVAAIPELTNALQRLLDTFCQAHPDVQAEIVTADGTELDFHLIWQSMDPPAAQNPPMVVGRRAVVAVMSPGNPISTTQLTVSQLASVFAAPETEAETLTWRGLGADSSFADLPVNTYGPGPRTEIALTFSAIVLGGGKLADTCTIVSSPAALAQRLMEDPAGIGFLALADIPTAPLASDGNEDPDFAALGKQPIIQELALMPASEKRTLPMYALAAWLASHQGQAAVVDASLYPVDGEQLLAGLFENRLHHDAVEAEQARDQLKKITPEFGVGAAVHAFQTAFQKAESALSDRKYREAELAYREALSTLPAMQALIRLREQTFAAQAQARGAARSAETHAAAEVAPDTFGEAFTRMAEADQFIRKEELTAANTAYREAAALYHKAASKAARSRFHSALSPEALEVVRAHAGKEWGQIAALIQTAEASNRENRHEEEADMWRQAREKLPKARDDALDVCWKSAGAFHAQQQPSLALSFAEKVLTLAPDHAEAEVLRRLLRSNHRFKPGDLHSNSVGITLAFVPPGTFVMGSPADEPARDSDEIPHKVTISHGFFMSVNEVTQRQWDDVMGKDYTPVQGVHPNDVAKGFIAPNLPKHTVTWYEARLFCERLSKQDGKRYRLPTEAEWEYACRAGTRSAFYTGTKLQPGQANVYLPGVQNADGPKAVGSFEPANAWRLNDMHGNLWEWCANWAAPYPEGDVVDPRGPDGAGERVDLATRVLRGGSWVDDAAMARAANRWEQMPTVGANYIGFRVVLEAAEVER